MWVIKKSLYKVNMKKGQSSSLALHSPAVKNDFLDTVYDQGAPNKMWLTPWSSSIGRTSAFNFAHNQHSKQTQHPQSSHHAYANA